MNHIKQFENKLYDEKCYWLLPTDSRFEDSMIKIKLPGIKINMFLHNYYVDIKYIFICYDYNLTKNLQWQWDSYNGKITNKFFEDNGYSFKGSVNITDLELDAMKYNI